MNHNQCNTGVSWVDANTQASINWVTDLLVKALCGAATILLSIAVASLEDLNSEIKSLADSVNELTITSSVVIETQKTLNARLEKLESQKESLNDKLANMLVRIEVVEARRSSTH